MSDYPTSIAEIDDRIAAARENLRELIEQAAAYSGAADEDLMSQRIADQEAQLDRLMKRRAELSAKPPD
jgi:predicted  nucleic acid-binding Zn-ribbon protein